MLKLIQISCIVKTLLQLMELLRKYFQGKSLDAGVTIWDNNKVQIHTISGTKLEETRAILGEELSVYMDMFNKMS